MSQGTINGPYYYKLTQESIEAYFRELAARSPIDIVVYISSAGVVPEVVMSLYRAARAGNWDKAKQIQFELLDLFSQMVGAPDFPEGFRTGYELHGFTAGNARLPLSPAEQGLIAEMRSKLACVLAGCGFSEAAGQCRISSPQNPSSSMDVDAIVQAVPDNIQATHSR